MVSHLGKKKKTWREGEEEEEEEEEEKEEKENQERYGNFKYGFVWITMGLYGLLDLCMEISLFYF